MGRVRNRFWVRSDRRDVPTGAPLDLSNERNKLPKCNGIQVRLVLSPYIPVQGSLCIQANENCYEMDKTSIFMFEILEPGGGGVSFGQIQHLRGLNSIALGYLNFTAGLT